MASIPVPQPQRWVGRFDPRIALAGIVLLSIAVRLAVNTLFEAPTILTDELTYATIARQFAHGDISLSSGYGIGYPLLVAPAWALSQTGTDAYTLAKAINAILMSLTAVPIFLWTRRIAGSRAALLAALLTVALPGFAYSGHVMTENAFVLALVTAAWAIARMVERQTILSQLLALIAIAAAMTVRPQALILLLALPCVILLTAALDARSRGATSIGGTGRCLLPYWPTAALGGLVVAIAAIATVASDWSWTSVLQAYGQTTNAQYTLENVSKYFLWHLGEATFALGVIPVTATIVVTCLAISDRSATRTEQAYAATTVFIVPLIILQVAAFTSYWSERVSERNMLCVFPILLIGLAVWVARDQPRPRRTTAIAIAASAVLVASIPFAFLYQRSPSTETWGIVLPETLSRKLPWGVDGVQFLVAVGTAVALLCFAILRGRLARVALPGLVIAYFAISQAAVTHEIARVSSDYRGIPGVGAAASWIEESVGRQPVTVITGSILGPDVERLMVWEQQFFNRSPITAVDLNGLAIQPDGIITGVDGQPPMLSSIVMAPWSLTLRGERLAENDGYALWRVSVPLAATRATTGIFPNGWMTPSATVDVYDARGLDPTIMLAAERHDQSGSAVPGTLAVSIGKPGTNAVGQPLSLEVSGDPTRTLIPTPAPPFRILLSADPPMPAQAIGYGAPRDVGARVDIWSGGTELVGRRPD